MTLEAKIWTGAWVAAALVSAVFVLSFAAALVASTLGDVPAVLTAINALWMPWGIVAVMLMIGLRWVASWSYRKGQSAHGR